MKRITTQTILLKQFVFYNSKMSHFFSFCFRLSWLSSQLSFNITRISSFNLNISNESRTIKIGNEINLITNKVRLYSDHMHSNCTSCLRIKNLVSNHSMHLIGMKANVIVLKFNFFSWLVGHLLISDLNGFRSGILCLKSKLKKGNKILCTKMVNCFIVIISTYLHILY